MSHSIPYVIQSKGEFESMKIDSNQTIKDIKKRIKSLYQIPEYCQKIYLDESELLDNDKPNKLGDYYPLILYNLNNLKLYIDIKKSQFEFFLGGSESISNLKQKIYNKLNIPVHKMKIYYSYKIVDDNQLIEDFIPNLSFKIQLLEIDKIKINLNKDNNIETIFVDPFSYVEDTPINKGYNFRLKFKDQFIYNRKLLCEYNLKNGDTIDLIEPKSTKINLKIMDRKGFKIAIVNVYPEDQIFILVDLLNIKEKSAKFSFDAVLYSIWSSRTFKEVEITEDSTLVLTDGRIIG